MYCCGTISHGTNMDNKADILRHCAGKFKLKTHLFGIVWLILPFQLSTKLIRFSKSAYPNVSFTSNERLFLMAEVCVLVCYFVIFHIFFLFFTSKWFIFSFWIDFGEILLFPESFQVTQEAVWWTGEWSLLLVYSLHRYTFYLIAFKVFVADKYFIFSLYYFLDETELLWERMDFARNHVAKRRGEGMNILSLFFFFFLLSSLSVRDFCEKILICL